MCTCMESTKRQCKECGEFAVIHDVQGSQEIMVCESCGWTSAEVTFANSSQDGYPPPSSSQYYVDGPTRQGRFFAPKNYQRAKERNFVKILKEMASKVSLPEHEISLCEQEGKCLLKAGEFGSFMKPSTAGLVFIALQRHSPTVKYKEVAQMLDINVKSLGKAVKALKKLPSISKPEVTVTNEERIQAAMDRLPSSTLSRDTQMRVKKMAIDIKELCAGRKVQGNYVSGLTSDSAILTVAMEAVEKKKMTKEWIDNYAKSIDTTPKSFRTRIWEIRTILVDLAEEHPSLGSKVKSKAITSRNIQLHVPTIVHSKAFLMTNPEDKERLESLDDGAAFECSSASLAFMEEDRYVHHDDDSDGDLSELDDDIRQYIASDKEVAQKQKMQEQQDS